MRCGLFGKLPAKRDFVAVAAPRAFLRLVEPWLERGLAESRKLLPPEEWADAFVSAPLWRFFLAAEMCHKPVLGAFVPSMDACGRLFPLTLFRIAEGRETISPPSADPHGRWFERAQAFLSATTDPRAPFEAGPEALHDLAGLCASEASSGDDHPLADDEVLRARIAQLVAERKAEGLASRTFWWSYPSGERDPVVRIEADMPDPVAFTQMLTVRHVPRSEPAVGVSS
jgi:type VI secretion system protein ImpM